MKKNGECISCCGTGILSASIKQTEDERQIAVVVCGGAHFSNEMAEKNILAMHAATGLGIDILGVEKPRDNSEKK